MKFIEEYSKYSVLVIHDFFSHKDIQKILDEANLINEFITLDDPLKTGSSLDENGNARKIGNGIFLDYLVTNRGRYLSSILRILDSFLQNRDIFSKYVEINPVNQNLLNTNIHYTLMNYYENNDLYDFHRDGNVYSIIHLFSEEPRAFDGGDVIFSINDEEITIPFRNNSSIIFPAAYLHKVSTIKMEEKLVDSNRMMGRFSFVQFLGIAPSPYPHVDG